MSALDTLKLFGIWLCGLLLVGVLAAVAHGRRVKARVARSLRLSEAVWAAQKSRVSTPTDVNGGDDTAIQPVPVAVGETDPDGNPRWKLRFDPPASESRSLWPVLDTPLQPTPEQFDDPGSPEWIGKAEARWPEPDSPLDLLARPGDGWWYGD